MLLGGTRAEEVVYGEISTGAHRPRARHEMARLMISSTDVGEVGPMIRWGPAVHVLKAPASLDREFSDETALAIDNENARIIDKIYDGFGFVSTARRVNDRGPPNSSSGRRWRAIAFASPRRRSAGG